MKLPELLEKQFVLPSIPKVVALLLTELNRPEVDLRRPGADHPAAAAGQLGIF